jgi:uncharacterized protein YndB with AHSA1/START domain
MVSKEKTTISIRTKINAPLNKVWKFWTTPGDIVKWNNASDDWYTPGAENDLRAGGKFNYRMEARDGSMGFNYEGVYTKVALNEQIDYTIGDGRKVKVVFLTSGNSTEIEETFEAESTHSIEIQRNGWQSILDNFKKYTEAD